MVNVLKFVSNVYRALYQKYDFNHKKDKYVF